MYEGKLGYERYRPYSFGSVSKVVASGKREAGLDGDGEGSGTGACGVGAATGGGRRLGMWGTAVDRDGRKSRYMRGNLRLRPEDVGCNCGSLGSSSIKPASG
jgi:hypothetical protein